MTPARRTRGFTLLPVVLAMTLIASIAFLLNRSNALNANMVASRADVERARYAAEAGLQAVNFAIQQAGCLAFYPTSGSPVVDTAFNGSAYSAYASAPFGWLLSLTSTGTHNGASVTLTRNNAYVYQSGVRTYVRQPNASAGVDTYVDKNNQMSNFGDSSELAISGSGFETLLKFDLSFFPSGSRVVPRFDSATGTLGPGALLEIYKITSGTSTPQPAYIDALVITQAGWREGTGSSSSGANWREYDGISIWPTPGVGYDARPVSTNLLRVSSGWQSIELTDATRAWMGSVHPNNGIWLRSSPSGYAVPSSRFHSSDYTSESSRRPRLTLWYLLPCGAAAP